MSIHYFYQVLFFSWELDNYNVLLNTQNGLKCRHLKLNQYTNLCSLTYLTPSVFSWRLKLHSSGVPKMFRQTSLQVYCWSCKFIDCLCLSTVSMAMASPSPANALPGLSVCRLMNSDWVNSRQDRTCETLTFKAT